MLALLACVMRARRGGATALHAAALQNHTGIAKLLLQHGANPSEHAGE